MNAAAGLVQFEAFAHEFPAAGMAGDGEKVESGDRLRPARPLRGRGDADDGNRMLLSSERIDGVEMRVPVQDKFRAAGRDRRTEPADAIMRLWVGVAPRIGG